MAANINIDPHFSVYELINRLNVQNIFTEHRKLLSAWSRSIEQDVVQNHLEAQIFAGFQQLEFFTPVFPRYQKIAPIARTLWVFGEPNAIFPAQANLNIAELKPDDKLVKEWFLVVKHENYARALVAREMTPRGTPHKDRVFQGIRTNNIDMVDIIAEWLANSVERTLP